MAEVPEGFRKVERPAVPEGFQKVEASPDDQFSFGEMVENVPSSAAGVVEDFVGGVKQVVTDPVGSAQAVGGVLGGAIQKLERAIVDVLPEDAATTFKANASPLFMVAQVLDANEIDLTENADAVVDAIQARYGSVEAAKETLEQDPVGALVDLSALVTGSGAVRGGAALNPINVTKNVGKNIAARSVPKNLPASMMTDVTKFSTTLTDAQRGALVNTMLKNNIMPSSKGLDDLADMIGDLNSRIDTLITTADGTVPKQAVFRHLRELRKDKGGVRIGAQEDLNAIDNIVGGFDQHLRKLKKDQLSAEDLQKLKVDAYKEINFDARRQKGTPIKEDTLKSVARGAKESIEELAPETKTVNKALGDLLELQPALQRAAARIENRNTIPLTAPFEILSGSTVGGIALGVEGAAAGAALGTSLAILGLPKVKAWNALKLQGLSNKSAAEIFLANHPGTSAAELAAIMGGRATEDDE